MKKLLYTVSATLLIFLVACSDENGTEANRVDFDVAAMLENYGNNLILPSYENLATQSATMQAKVEAFTQSPTENTLEEAQLATLAAWEAYQKTGAFEFGPGETANLRMEVAHFPIVPSSIESNITNGNWDLDGAFRVDYVGFSAAEYLLFAYDADGSEAGRAESGTKAEVLSLYTTDAQATQRAQFLNDVVSRINLQVQQVYTGWKANGGNYIGTFIANTNTGAGSSISLFVNSYLQNYEWIKNEKLRDPSGINATNRQPAPRSLEAYYSDYTKALLLAADGHSKDAFLGQYYGKDPINGSGLEDYLTAHFAAGNTEANYGDAMEAYLDANTTAVLNIDTPVKTTLASNSAQVVAAYEAYQAAMILLKVDITNTLGVSITFTDNDGD